MTRVDILLPYWGDFWLLEKTVRSVLSQTVRDWHLYVFDDCYPSNEAAEYFKALKDSRVTYFRHKKNIGITKNFNYALKSVHAEYCVMIGCDDIMLPNYLKAALNNIRNADFYQPNIEIIDEQDRVYLPLADRVKMMIRPKEPGMYSGEKLATSLCRGNWLYFPSIMWKSNVIKKYNFDDKFRIVEDLVLELNIIKDGGTLCLDNEKSFQYRRYARSLSSIEKAKGGVRFAEENEIYEHYVNIFKTLGWKKAARAARWRITSRMHQLIT